MISAATISTVSAAASTVSTTVMVTAVAAVTAIPVIAVATIAAVAPAVSAIASAVVVAVVAIAAVSVSVSVAITIAAIFSARPGQMIVNPIDNAARWQPRPRVGQQRTTWVLVGGVDEILVLRILVGDLREKIVRAAVFLPLE
jgi:hypothetical protein